MMTKITMTVFMIMNMIFFLNFRTNTVTNSKLIKHSIYMRLRHSLSAPHLQKFNCNITEIRRCFIMQVLMDSSFVTQNMLPEQDYSNKHTFHTVSVALVQHLYTENLSKNTK